MAKDLGDVIGTAVGRAARETAKNVAASTRKGKNSPVSGLKGLAVGAGLAAAAPLAAKGISKLAKGASDGVGNPVKKAGEKATSSVGDKVKSGVTDAVTSKLPGGGDDGDGDSGGGGGKGGQPGVGKGRRMPVQQSVDVPVPVSAAYNQWTQFEEWPKFMHRLQSVSQEDETHVNFKAKIWGISKEFTAEIVEQRPDERIEWRVTQGLSHKGVVTFHELADRLTRIELSMDVEPGSMIEKAARGMRHVKRAVRADLHRFKAYTVMNEEPDGEWRGKIEDAEVKPLRKPSPSRRSRSSNGGDPSKSRAKPKAKASNSRSSKSSSSRSSNGRSRSNSRSKSNSRSQSRSRSKSGSRS
jgi:uncharacterized membrane protein